MANSVAKNPPYDEKQGWYRVSRAQAWVTEAPSWSQAWGQGTTANARSRPLPMGTGRASFFWVAAKGGDLGGPIPGCRS